MSKIRVHDADKAIHLYFESEYELTFCELEDKPYIEDNIRYAEERIADFGINIESVRKIRNKRTSSRQGGDGYIENRFLDMFQEKYGLGRFDVDYEEELPF